VTLFHAPLIDLRFVLEDVIGTQRLAELPVFNSVSPATIVNLAADAAELILPELASLRLSSEAGCRYVDGRVITPPGYRDIYGRLSAAGWFGITHQREHGGGGMPFLLGCIVEEMLCSANISFALYPVITSVCYEAIAQFASDSIRTRYLSKIGSGEWTAALCLTEPHAGSDRGVIKTRAIQNSDGSYRIEGIKIFVSGGDHDLTENIVYLVMARTPASPPGMKGVSLFVVPKYQSVDIDRLGGRNAVRCVSIENKMGMQGSATCTMAFEGATAWCIGRIDEGLLRFAALTDMQRIGVGVQGLGLCELATQAAILYARERHQGNGRAIIEHPDVRRMLLRMKSITESLRVMAYEVALSIDIARYHPDDVHRQEAQDWVELTSPLLKVIGADTAFELGSLAIQVHGGHGYIREQGIEQIARDAKCLALYAGSNGLHAMDFVQNTIRRHGGRLPHRFFSSAERSIQDCSASEQYLARPLKQALGALRVATKQIQKNNQYSRDVAFSADDYLRAFALTLLGWNCLRMVHAIRQRRDGFSQAKRATAHYFVAHIITQVPHLCESAMSSAKPMLDLPSADF
jgi:alkylation response protein AidB-like acyl-CoA dehydrogenase